MVLTTGSLRPDPPDTAGPGAGGERPDTQKAAERSATRPREER